MRGFVVGVVRIKQRNEYVDIEESYHLSLSRSRFTSSKFGFLALGLGVNSGTPFRVIAWEAGAIALRISSETIWPIVM